MSDVITVLTRLVDVVVTRAGTVFLLPVRGHRYHDLLTRNTRNPFLS